MFKEDTNGNALEKVLPTHSRTQRTRTELWITERIRAEVPEVATAMFWTALKDYLLPNSSCLRAGCCSLPNSQAHCTLQSSSCFLQLNLLQPFPSKTMLKSFKGSQALSSRTQRKRADHVSPPSLAVPSSHAANFQHILIVYLVCSNLLCIVLCGVQAQELRIQRGIQHSGKPWSFGDSAPHAAARG